MSKPSVVPDDTPPQDSMRELLRGLAYRWCEDYGDKEHKTHHRDDQKQFSQWCPNCADGLNFAKDVARAIRERIS
jgi:hypothetical protein